MKNDFWRIFWILFKADDKAEPVSTFDEREIVMANNGANSCSAN